MASIGHIAVGMAAGRLLQTRIDPSVNARRWMVALALLSLVPDLDVIGFWLGIEYEDPFGHRGATHSIAFAVIAGLIGAALAKPLKMKPLPLGLLLGGVMLGVAAGAAIAVGVTNMADSGRVAAQIPPMDSSEVPRAIPAAGQVALSFAPMVKSAAPAVVNIFTEGKITERLPLTGLEQLMPGALPPRYRQRIQQGFADGKLAWRDQSQHRLLGLRRDQVTLDECGRSFWHDHSGK
jgi:hypothetical protein